MKLHRIYEVFFALKAEARRRGGVVLLPPSSFYAFFSIALFCHFPPSLFPARSLSPTPIDYADAPFCLLLVLPRSVSNSNRFRRGVEIGHFEAFHVVDERFVVETNTMMRMMMMMMVFQLRRRRCTMGQNQVILRHQKFTFPRARE